MEIAPSILYTNERLEEKKTRLNNKMNKTWYNENVRHYKDLVYSFRELEYDVWTAPDTADVSQLIDYWVVIFEATIWNYDEAPFQFVHQDNDDIGQLTLYYRKHRH